MGLFKPVWMTSSYKKREKAVKYVQEISDQEVLCQIALQAPQSPVREAAIDRITDQKILAKVYIESKDGFDCSRALGHLSDQSVLKEILYSDIADYSKSKVVEKLTGRDDLREIAEQFDDRQVYYEALKKLYSLKDADGLISILENSPVPAKKSDALQIIRQHSSFPIKLTESDNGRIFETLLKDGTGWYTENLPRDLTGLQLRRVYKEALREDLRVQAFARIAEYTPSQKLLETYTIATESLRASDNNSVREAWDKVKKTITARLVKRESRNTEVLMQFLRNVPEVDEICCRCLFSPDLDGTEGIEEMRDEAVETRLSNLFSSHQNEEEYRRKRIIATLLCQFANMLSPEARKKYGFIVTHEETADSDEFGDYTYKMTTVQYKGETYHN